ncbi:MAG: DUF6044 family protein [Candidatus Margulisiibacteriota bacterium]
MRDISAYFSLALGWLLWFWRNIHDLYGQLRGKWDWKKTLVVGLFAFTLLPLFVLGERVAISAWDQHDSEIAWRTVLVDSHTFWDRSTTSTVPQIMNGIPRAVLPSAYSVTNLLYALMSPIAAFITNEILIRCLAFLGMGLLTTALFFKEPEQAWMGWWIALCFASLSFITVYGLTVAGQPLLLYALYQIAWRQYRYRHFGVVMGFAFYSSLFFGGLFILIGCSLAVGVFWVKEKKLHRPLLMAMGVLGITYAVVEAPLLKLMLTHQLISQRAEFSLGDQTFRQSLLQTWDFFFNSSGHVISAHLGIAVLVFPIALGIALYKKQYRKTLVGLFTLCVAFSFFYGFWGWQGLIEIRKVFPFLVEFNASRFYWFNPLLWYLLFAIGIHLICQTRARRWAILLLVAQLVFVIDKNPIFKDNWGTLMGNSAQKLTYERFYAVDLFAQIKSQLPPPSTYRVVAVGLYPSILTYNGFYTLDAYQNCYPLSYKHQFRQLMAEELDKDPQKKSYFDTFGSRCYLMPAELHDWLVPKEKAIPIQSFNFNTEAFKKMGGRYVFSAVPFAHPEAIQLVLVNQFSASEVPYDVYVYEVGRGD